MINAIYDGEDIQVLTNLQKESRFFIGARYGAPPPPPHPHKLSGVALHHP